ncbi:hypothetical protein MCAP1_000974 [Malassezia caprae]|uniref:Vacuolar protein 14 C-terminal Fig4-binding domain-containing protein n=1 Tax=Malassezia caprae TaxID=1381934 RepID=A0AAF0E4P6_9BASI|nr:hypothetical protein MCAP1_000974 [Malassezia caprae]
MDASLQKALFDRVYDKRKAAALDLERHVRDCVARQDRAKIGQIVQQLCSFLTEKPPPNANARNGGLIGLAGIGIALGQEVAAYLDQMIGPVLACFSDADPKTRYFACESFYNIAKVCKGEILVYFNEVFVVLARLAADSEVSVKNGAELLDRLFKDIVCECAPHYVSVYQDVSRVRARQDRELGLLGGTQELAVAREKAEHERYLSEMHEQHDHRNTVTNKAFSLARLVPLLSERMQVISPLTRNYLVGWIAVLDSVPDLQLVAYLSVFLKHLFQYLGDPNTDVRVATAEVLAGFLREIREAAQHQSHLERPSAEPPAESAREEPEDEASATGDDEADELVWIHSSDVRIEYDALIEILLELVQDHDVEIQATTFEWITEFLRVVPDMVVPFTPRLISSVLPCLAHPAPAIQMAAIETNKQLFTAVEQLPALDGTAGALDSFATTNALKQHLVDQHDQARLQALEWLMMLHAKSPSKLFSMEDGSVSLLLRVLSDPSEEVILSDMRLLIQICSQADERHFRVFMSDLLELFATDRKLLETWGSLIVRQLCANLQTERVFCMLAEILESYADLEFASIMVQNLNLILVASQELRPLRRRLRALDARENQQLFVRLYRCWSHNAISAFCLCLLTQAYEHAYHMLRIFAELEVSLSMLLQIDKLVQLIESPIFTSLRLQLLEPEQHPFLFKCLYGMLMLLPQSSAFATLRNRLHAINGLGYLALPNRTSAPSRAQRLPMPESAWNDLLAHFRAIQQRHERTRTTAPTRAATERARETSTTRDEAPRRRRNEAAPFAATRSTAPLGVTHVDAKAAPGTRAARE